TQTSTITESNGNVVRVDFVSGDNGIATVTTPDLAAAFQTTINGVSVGNTTYTATATMNAGVPAAQCVDTSSITVVNPNPWWQTAVSAPTSGSGSITTS